MHNLRAASHSHEHTRAKINSSIFVWTEIYFEIQLNIFTIYIDYIVRTTTTTLLLDFILIRIYLFLCVERSVLRKQ